MMVPTPDRKEATLAAVYNPPSNFRQVPDLDEFMFEDPGHPYKKYDHRAHHEAEMQWVADLAALARTNGTSDYLGEVLYFPRGDGNAMYMVWKTSPLQLVFLPIGDAWTIPDAHMRGLKLADVKAQIDRERGLRELFAERKAT